MPIEHMMNKGALEANKAMDRRRLIDQNESMGNKLNRIIELLEILITAQNNQSFKSDGLPECDHQGAYVDSDGWHCPRCSANKATA